MIFDQIQDLAQGKPLIVVCNKVDLLGRDGLAGNGLAGAGEEFGLGMGLPEAIATAPQVPTAAAQGQGLDRLEQALLSVVQLGGVQAANLDLAINQRQAAALTRAQVALAQVQQTIAEALPFDFWTIDLRSAIQAFNQVTGEGVTEPVLERIFSRFCIGK